MIFTAPALLLALLALPGLWWLLRVTPPAPRRQIFPAIRLLIGLSAPERTPARTPWWILALRLAAAALAILGLAGPVLHPGGALPGRGPVLLVVDTGWAAAPDWAARMRAGEAVLGRAERAGRAVALLATAADGTGAAPRVSAALPAAAQQARLAALRPESWPPDRGADRAALAAARAECARSAGGCPGAVVFLADGLADGPGFAGFARALADFGPVRELRPLAPPPLLLAPRAGAEGLDLQLVRAASPLPLRTAVLAETASGQPLAETALTVPAGQTRGTARLVLPLEIRNRIARLVLRGVASAGGVVLLDQRWRRRSVGLATDDPAASDTPFLGALYYVRRALAPYADLREAELPALLRAPVAAIVLADAAPPEGAEHDALSAWVRRGGMLIRFAGPKLAALPPDAADKLLPVRLLAGDRALGGAMSWSQPEHLAPFPPASPFAGLAVPRDVTVRTQVLARPSPRLARRVWASLADGTPLVTGRRFGQGQVVLFHVAANASWSSLPLSGLFVSMLRRLVALSAGVVPVPGRAMLAPYRTLDGFGVLGAPPPAARGLAADRLDALPAGPRAPPGLYGPARGRRARNLGAGLAAPVAAPTVPGAVVGGFAEVEPGTRLGPWLVAAACGLLVLDLLVALALRGLLPGRGAIAAALIGLATVGLARAAEVPPAALGARLGYVVTFVPEVDRVARQGLDGLAAMVNARTAAALRAPEPVVPGRTDLSFYPLLYWPVLPDAPPLPAAGVRALQHFMDRGGILVIDTGLGPERPADPAALRRALRGLAIPPLAPLSIKHVLARAFYLLRTYPGRYAGGSVWVARHADRGTDDVSPVVIGSSDWAAAWAIDRDGLTPYAAIPGGAEQRALADRFGINLVMYALTGSYKGDQLQMRAIIQRLGR